jgi:hypothetical protein
LQHQTIDICVIPGLLKAVLGADKLSCEIREGAIYIEYSQLGPAMVSLFHRVAFRQCKKAMH